MKTLKRIILTNKLSPDYFNKTDDIIPLFSKQFECTGADFLCTRKTRYLCEIQKIKGIMTVLSDMSNMEQMKDNLSFMKDFKPLIEKESDTIQSVCEIFKPQKIVLNAENAKKFVRSI